jgi:hypothetical protein
MHVTFRIASGMGALLLMASCGGSESSGAIAVTTPATTTTAPAGLPSMYGQFYGVQVSLDGTTVVLRATSVPDHKSPYFGSGNALYEPPSAGMVVNPHHIESQSLVLRVPASPVVGSPSDTNLGPIGVAVNGVAFFNQYAANRTPLDDEIRSFDRYNGHPAPTNIYHYHMEPLYLTAQGSSRLLGVLLDGFPVYGTQDADGHRPTDLDACNGHVRATPEFPAGIYHYHVVATPPYISGCFRGTPGGRG